MGIKKAARKLRVVPDVKWMTLSQAGRALKVNRGELSAFIERGKLILYKPHKQRRVLAEQVFDLKA